MPSIIQDIISSALDPKSEMVYFLANGASLLLLLATIFFYIVLRSYHFIVMFLLGTGLLISINYVWMHRDPTCGEDISQNKQKTNKKSPKKKNKKNDSISKQKNKNK